MATVTEPSPLGANRSKRLYVAHIGEFATEAEMRTIFSGYGTIVEIQMVKDHQTGKQKGFCFITYEHEDQADRAYNDRERITYNSRPIEIRLAEPRKTGPPASLNNVFSQVVIFLSLRFVILTIKKTANLEVVEVGIDLALDH